VEIHFGSELLKAEWHEAVGCLGTFDGVHRGHQRVISSAVQLAREQGLPCVLITFDRHPAAILAPDRCPKAIASLSQNIRAFRDLGVSIALILPFTAQLSQTTAQEFLDHVFIGAAKVKHLVVGHDFAFGKGREGTTAWLQERIDTHVIPPFELDGQRVSSSAIRSAIEAGEVDRAAMWLGRDFAIDGIVVAGQKLGRQLGYPTINLARAHEGVLPLDGIYSGSAKTRLGVFRAAISIGYRPTVDGTNRTIEAFLIDYPGDEIYGDHVELGFHRRLRGEETFASLEDLRAQIARDVADVANDRTLI
jgi:riboflavin kinase/FMN adenylyltransferase